jgi:hypothetical protein
MSSKPIGVLLSEFEPIRNKIARPKGKDRICLSRIPGLEEEPELSERRAIANFCSRIRDLLAGAEGFPDSDRYAWAKEPRWFGSSFEAWGQSIIVSFLIGLWEFTQSRCDKTVIVRAENTGGYHFETYGTANGYFLCTSYHFFNLVNRYAILNHELIAVGADVEPVACVVPTNVVGGQIMERAIRTRWTQCGSCLNEFLLSVVGTIGYEENNVLLTEHVALSERQFLASEKYSHLRKGFPSGMFFLPPEAWWTLYPELILQFSFAHELSHILRGDLKNPGRNANEEVKADEGALEVMGYTGVVMARRLGYDKITGTELVVGPALFLAISRLFAFFDALASGRPWDESFKEKILLMRRSSLVARLLEQYKIPPGATVFWDVMSELRILEVGLRRWIWSASRNGRNDPEAVLREIEMEHEFAEKERHLSEEL